MNVYLKNCQFTTQRELQVFESRITKIKTHTSQLKSFELNIPESIKWSFLPGQYIDLALMEKPKEYSGFSLTSSSSHTDKITISVKLATDSGLTSKLFAMSEGDPVMIRGPGGTFCLDLDNCHTAVLLGGGIGITPLISMYKSSIENRNMKQVALFHSAKTTEELIHHDELKTLASMIPKAHYIPVVTRDNGWVGQTSRITPDQVLNFVNNNQMQDPWFYICGPGQFNSELHRVFIEAGYDEHKVQVESYYEP